MRQPAEGNLPVAAARSQVRGKQITGWLVQNKRLRSTDVGPQLKAAFALQFMEAPFKYRGSKIPSAPPRWLINKTVASWQWTSLACDEVRNLKQPTGHVMERVVVELPKPRHDEDPAVAAMKACIKRLIVEEAVAGRA